MTHPLENGETDAYRKKLSELPIVQKIPLGSFRRAIELIRGTLRLWQGKVPVARVKEMVCPRKLQ
jgi:hypothetical protein